MVRGLRMELLLTKTLEAHVEFQPAASFCKNGPKFNDIENNFVDDSGKLGTAH